MKRIEVQVVLMDNGYAVQSTIVPGYHETKTIHGSIEDALDKATALISGTFKGFKKAEEDRLLTSGN